MNIDHNVVGQLMPEKQSHNHQMGTAWNVPVFEAKHGEKEGMIISEKTFNTLTEIVDGFIKMGRDYVARDTRDIPKVSKEVNNILLHDKTEVGFKEVDHLGFYHYKIRHKGNMISFDIEPTLLPLYLYVIRDMMYRHSKNPTGNIISNNYKDLSPISSVDEAIRRISDSLEQNDLQK